MHRLAIRAIQLVILWAVSTGIVWASVRVVGRRLNVADAASIAFVGSLLSIALILIGGVLGVFLLWTGLIWCLCRISLWRAAVSSAIMQALAFVLFHVF